jgi:hypothetical protein
MLEKLKNVLNSTRFWSLVVGAVVVYLSAKGYLGEAERNLIGTILGSYIVVDTSQKFQSK